jgi:hypothetical protein
MLTFLYGGALSEGVSRGGFGMLTQEERALLVEVQDRLLELYVHREQASKTRDWKRIDSLDADIAEVEARRREIRRMDTVGSA